MHRQRVALQARAGAFLSDFLYNFLSSCLPVQPQAALQRCMLRKAIEP